MKKLVWKKLKGQSGETLTETLVALLIAALALTMLAGMISSTTRIVTQSKATMKTYYEENNQVAKQVAPEASATIILAPNVGMDGAKDYSVSVYLNNTLGNTPVVSYRVPTPSPSPTPSAGS